MQAEPDHSADKISSAAPTPKTSRRILQSRRKRSSSPTEKSSRMIPNSAKGSIACGIGDGEIVEPGCAVDERAEPGRADQHADQDEADHRADAQTGEGGNDDPGGAEDDQGVAKAGSSEFASPSCLYAASGAIVSGDGRRNGSASSAAARPE